METILTYPQTLGSAHGVVVITLIVLVLGTIILLLLVLTALPMLTDQ